MNRLCACGHAYRIHGRSWIPDDHCRAWQPQDGPCHCDLFTEAATQGDTP